jgi:hypothetical protein
MGVAAILTLWAQAADDWPIWAIPAVWGPLVEGVAPEPGPAPASDRSSA